MRGLAERLKAAGGGCGWISGFQAADIILLKVDQGLEQLRALLLCTAAAPASGGVALER